MIRLKLTNLTVVLALALLMVGNVDASSVMHFPGSFAYGDSLQFEADGVIMDATAFAVRQTLESAYVVQSSLGLGVYSLGEETTGEIVQIDGLGANEALVMSFDQVVKLEQIGFSLIDQVGDEVSLYDGDFNLLGVVALSPGVNGEMAIALNNIVGDEFVIAVTDPSDAYTVCAIQFTAVPTPHAAWMGFSMLISMAITRRRLV